MNDGYRKAALKLHGLSIADRDWMLQRLPAEESAQLSELLRELQELGVESDQSISAHLSADEVRQGLMSATSDRTAVADALKLMCAASPAEISQLLTAEPDTTVAAVLSLYPWPWREQFLAGQGVEKRQRIGRALRQATQTTPRVRAELIKISADRLVSLRRQNQPFAEMVAEKREGAAHKPGMQSLWQGIRRWLP